MLQITVLPIDNFEFTNFFDVSKTAKILVHWFIRLSFPVETALV